jgi:hypothetical protein
VNELLAMTASANGGTIYEHCHALDATDIGKVHKRIVVLTLAACLGQNSLKKHLDISRSDIIGSSDLLRAVHAEKVTAHAIIFGAAVCGFAGCIVHSCFIFAGQRKIAGRLLSDQTLAMSKLADLATLEAVLILRHKMLLSDPTNLANTNLREICRCAMQISAQAMELKAGSAIVHAGPAQSDLEVLLLLVTTALAEVERAQQA